VRAAGRVLSWLKCFPTYSRFKIIGDDTGFRRSQTGEGPRRPRSESAMERWLWGDAAAPRGFEQSAFGVADPSPHGWKLFGANIPAEVLLVVRLLAALRGLVYASGFVLLWWWVVVSVRPIDTRLAVALPEWVAGPGFVLAVVGGALALWCLGAFALMGKGTPAPFDAPREVVVAGPYRYVRNPMYLGAVAILLGTGLMLRSPSTVAVALLFMVLAHLFVVYYEEPTLEGQFGDSYRRYRKSVNRWLPGLPQGDP